MKSEFNNALKYGSSLKFLFLVILILFVSIRVASDKSNVAFAVPYSKVPAQLFKFSLTENLNESIYLSP